MDISIGLIEGVVVMFAIISLAVLLKKIGILSKNDDQLFSRIVLQITVPAVIFSSLAVKQFDSEFLIMAVIMAVIEISIIILAWSIASLLKFERGEKGGAHFGFRLWNDHFTGLPHPQAGISGKCPPGFYLVSVKCKSTIKTTKVFVK